MPTLTQTKPLSWNDVRTKVEATAKRKSDLYASPGDMTMLDNGKLQVRNADGTFDLGLRDLGVTQLASKLGIGATYAHKLRSEHGDPELFARNVNHWLKQEDPAKQLLVRTITDEEDGERKMRALLTSKYGIFDDLEMFNVAEGALKASGVIDRLTIEELWESDASFHLRLTDKQNAFDAAKAYLQTARPGQHGMLRDSDPDFLYPMFHWSNSEVGLHKVRGEGGVWRVRCTNGLVLHVSDGASFARRHYGESDDDLRTFVVEQAENILRTATTATTTFAETQGTVIENPAETLQTFLDKKNVTRPVQRAVFNELNVAPPEAKEQWPAPVVTTYDAINAVTGTARGLSPENRIVLERIAADLLKK